MVTQDLRPLLTCRVSPLSSLSPLLSVSSSLSRISSASSLSSFMADPSSPSLSSDPLLPPLSPLPAYPSPYVDLLSAFPQAFCNDDYTFDLSSFLLDETLEREIPDTGTLERETLQQPDLHQDQVGWLEMEVKEWSGMAKAARSKRRIARQMSNCTVPRFVLPRRMSSSSSSSSSSPPLSASPRKSSRKSFRESSPAVRALNIFPPVHLGLRYVLHKELKNSDVTSLGRIVLPKRESEIYLPFLSIKEGIQITVRDMFSRDAWRMRYRFWPNNKSRMYVLENTGEYIRKNCLICGDVVALYQDDCKQLYICSRKAGKSQYAIEMKKDDQDVVISGGMLGGEDGVIASIDEMMQFHEEINHH